MDHHFRFESFRARINVPDRFGEPSEMKPKIHLGHVTVPMPNMPRPGCAGEERSKQYVV